MREVGERLKRAREEKGITLAEIQNSTKIRTRYLQALEEGEFQIIPGEVYVRGFLQTYGTAVGLDPRELLAFYDQLRSGEANPAPETTPLPDGCEARHPAITWWQPALVGIVLLLAAGLIFILVAKTSAPPVKGNTAVQPSPRSAASVARDTNGRPVAPSEIRLVLRFTARCWLQVRLDGRLVFSDTLGPGVEKEWKASEVIEVQFGNAGGVRAELNGRDLGVLGAVGQNLTREFRRS
ncbi:MAG: RodZ domain-containing protein [Bacteroidota bacterium]